MANSAKPQSKQTTSSGNTQTWGSLMFFNPQKWIAISPVNLPRLLEPHDLHVIEIATRLSVEGTKEKGATIVTFEIVMPLYQVALVDGPRNGGTSTCFSEDLVHILRCEHCLGHVPEPGIVRFVPHPVVARYYRARIGRASLTGFSVTRRASQANGIYRRLGRRFRFWQPTGDA